YFDVSDTGFVMTKAQLDNVFDPFSQADASMSRKYGGTGLGTTISKQLVELMGGNICATSEEGKGTTFTFRLPLEVVALDETSKADADAKITHIESTLNILVVDDVQQNIELLSLLLKRSGHKVETATDGLIALKKMRAQSFDVVLMDLQMPNLDGLEAAKQRRLYEKDQGLPATPIIALTASVLVQDKYEAEQAGMEGFANKPVDFSLLMEEIVRVLNLETEQVKVSENALPTQHRASTLSVEKHILDINKAIDLWGNEDTVLQEVDKFTSSCRDKIDALMSAAIREDYKAVAALAHGLKGTSGNLCLTTFFRTTRDIESQALKSHVDIENINVLRDALDKIELMLSESPLYAEDAINESIDNELLLSHLMSLLESVDKNMVDEEELAFLREVGCSSHKEQITQIILDIDDFEFELAHERISLMIEELK
ncbi:MAG: response regulator, partial [Pseudomonadota bacterium]|nr:response regulator [Pseudomonadota bacterium]